MIEFPYRYVKLVNKTTLYIIIGFTWTFNTIVPCVLVTVYWLKLCGTDIFRSECDGFAMFRPFRFFIVLLSCTSVAVTVIVYSKISMSVRRHTREERVIQARNAVEQNTNKISSKTQLASTKTILIIIFSSVILQSPYLFASILTECLPEIRQFEWRERINLIVRICHELNAYVTLFLYIWRFPECRMNFYYMFSKISNTYRTKGETLRMEVFNIVTFDRNN